MDRNLKITVAAAVGLVIVCIAILAVVYIWNIYAITSYNGGGGSLFFHYSGSGDDGVPLNATQYSQNGTLSGQIYVEGDSETMLMALRDYNVTAFYYNGSINKTHMIAQNAYINESHYVVPYDAAQPQVPFSVTGIPDGFHDIELVGFVDPYNFTGEDWRMDGPKTAGGLRFNVIVNDSNKATPVYTDSSASNDTLYSTTYRLGGLTKEPFSDRLWQKEKVEGGRVIDYYLNLRPPVVNGRAQNHSFAIVQLLDYKQVPIRVNSPDMVYYGGTDNNTSAAVHLSIRAPDTPGSYKLVIIVTEDPYADLEVAPYVEDNRTWTINRNISSSIDVEHQDIIVA